MNIQNLESTQDLSLKEIQKHLQGHDDYSIAENLLTHPLGRIRKLGSSIKKELVGRDEAVDAVLASFVSRVPVVLFGPPGTAKSLLVRMIADRTTDDHDQSSFFEYLMTMHTMPEELFGAIDIKKLVQDTPEFQRSTQGMLPEKDFVFLDEIFRGGSHILNTLLTVVNEGKFHDGSKTINVKAVGIVGAANFPPTGTDLQAFYDRFPIRIWLDSICSRGGNHAADTVEELLQKTLALRNPQPRAISCGNDFRVIQEFDKLYGAESFKAADSEVKDQFLDAFREAQRRPEFDLSDRSLGLFWRWSRAFDLLHETDANRWGKRAENYLEVFRHMGSSQEGAKDAERFFQGRSSGSEFGTYD